jgi:hypothetical protein
MAGVQTRYPTQSTSEEYVTGKLWRHARLACCPWHPQGGCGLRRHGTYPRVSPPGTQIARWYCPRERRTVSALPDCLAAHRTDTLTQCEAMVRALEQARSLAAAAAELRTDIELPGALRYLSRLRTAIHSALRIIRGLEPARFLHAEPTLSHFAAVLDTEQVLMTLREQLCDFLPQLPAPLGFNPRRTPPAQRLKVRQHAMGRAPPCVFVDPAR